MLILPFLTSMALASSNLLKSAIKNSQRATFSTAMKRDIVIPCSDGLEIAAKYWEAPNPQPEGRNPNRILLLHGWLDNVASYHLLAPRINEQLNAQVLAIDFPGHGHSSHKSCDGPPQLITEYAVYVAETLNNFEWGRYNNNDEGDANTDTKADGGVTLIGHSMGAGVSLIYASAFPEQIQKILLLEGAGPLARDATNISSHIRASISRRLRSNRTLFPQHDPNNQENNNNNGRQKAKKKVHQNLDSAIATRKKTAELSPGNQYISSEAAAALVCRATLPVDASHDATKAGGEEIPMDYDGPVSFRHDLRLTLPSLQYFTKRQVDELYKSIQSPVFMILAQDGWPVDSGSAESVTNLLRPKKQITLPGSHHFHADPDTAEDVIDAVIDCLKN